MTRATTVVLWLAALTIATASPAWTGLTTAHLSNDTEIPSMNAGVLFGCEGSIANDGGAVRFEIIKGGDTDSPEATALITRPNGTAVPWTLSYDHITQEISFTVDGTTYNWTTQLSGFSDLFVRTRAAGSGTQILVENLVIDTKTVGDISNADGDISSSDILWISGGTIADGFTLSGETTVRWTGTPPNQSLLSFQIVGGNLNVAKLEKVTWGRFKSMFGH